MASEMTLIALATRPIPVLLGDLLVTGRRRRLNALPSLGATRMLDKSQRGVFATSLIQKIALISPTIAVAWSGSLIVARRVLSDLRKYTLHNPDVTARQIHSWIQRLEYFEWNQLTMIGLLCNNGYVETFVIGNRYARKTRSYGHVFVAGSGSEHLRSYVGKMDAKYSYKDVPPYTAILTAGIIAFTEEFFFSHDSIAWLWRLVRDCISKRRANRKSK
jgi:hypothetical protein